MDRRGFLRALGLGVAAAVAPKVTYGFFGGILRPKLETRPMYWHIDTIGNPMKVYIEVWNRFGDAWERLDPHTVNGVLVAEVPTDARYTRFCATYDQPVGAVALGSYMSEMSQIRQIT